MLLVLILVAGVGGWNYHRNWQIDKQQERTRPYSGYQTEDLEALLDAFKSDIGTSEARLRAAKSARGRVSRGQGMIADNVDQFAATTRTSSKIRNAAGDLAVQQSQVADLEKELAYRSSFGSGMQIHLRRLTTF